MASRTWVGGNNGNDAGTAANWSPAGAPQPGDALSVHGGTLEITGGVLAGNTLDLTDHLEDGAHVTLDLNGMGARAAIEGTRWPGAELIVNATGKDFLDATAGYSTIGGGRGGSINLADHAHLYVTGTMSFGYGASITGGVGSCLTNYGLLDIGSDSTVSAAVNGDGTLKFDGYHNQRGYAEIASPITMAQTVELNPAIFGLTMTLADPADFHALLRIDPPQNPGEGPGDVSVVVRGVAADGFVVAGDQMTLTHGGSAVDRLHVAAAGSLAITAAYGADTTLTFKA